VFLADGPVLLAEALDAGADLESVVVESAAAHSDPVTRAGDAGVAVRVVEDGVLARVLDVVTPQAVVTVVRRRTPPLEQVVSGSPDGAPLLVLVGLQDPGNAGTLVRVAEASGCRGVVLTANSVDLTNPKTVRATAGSVFRVPVATGPPVEEVLDACDAAGLATWATVRGGAEDAAAEDYTRADLGGPLALLVGSEAHGLDPAVARRCRGRLTIPMSGRVDSLNAGVAGAVVLFEAARRRRSATEWRGVGGSGPQ
jgi:TrmH family RNA methyltransferase